MDLSIRFPECSVQPYAFPVRWFEGTPQVQLLVSRPMGGQNRSRCSESRRGKSVSIERFAAILNIPLFAFISVSNHLAVTVRKRLIHEPMEAD